MSQTQQSSNMIKMVTSAAFNYVSQQQEKRKTDFNIFTCPAPKITCQGDRTSGIFMSCSKHHVLCENTIEHITVMQDYGAQ